MPLRCFSDAHSSERVWGAHAELCKVREGGSREQEKKKAGKNLYYTASSGGICGSIEDKRYYNLKQIGRCNAVLQRLRENDDFDEQNASQQERAG